MNSQLFHNRLSRSPDQFQALIRNGFFTLLPCLQAEVKLQMREIDGTEQKSWVQFLDISFMYFLSCRQTNKRRQLFKKEDCVCPHEEPSECVWNRWRIKVSKTKWNIARLQNGCIRDYKKGHCLVKAVDLAGTAECRRGTASNVTVW